MYTLDEWQEVLRLDEVVRLRFKQCNLEADHEKGTCMVGSKSFIKFLPEVSNVCTHPFGVVEATTNRQVSSLSPCTPAGEDCRCPSGAMGGTHASLARIAF